MHKKNHKDTFGVHLIYLEGINIKKCVKYTKYTESFGNIKEWMFVISQCTFEICVFLHIFSRREKF